MKFYRVIYKDLRSLEKSVGDGSEENSNLDMFSLEMFENIAYIMAKHADPSISDFPEDWMDLTLSLSSLATADSALGFEHADRD